MQSSRPASSINTDGQVAGLSIRDMVRNASLNLRGSSKTTDSGYIIELRNYEKNLYTSVQLDRAKEVPGASDLTVRTGKLDEAKITSGITLANLKHLYVSWETPGTVTFCFSSEGRYTVINVSHESGSFILSSVDRRKTEAPPRSEQEAKARSQRRTFYHIGTLFDRAELTSEEDMIDEMDD